MTAKESAQKPNQTTRTPVGTMLLVATMFLAAFAIYTCYKNHQTYYPSFERAMNMAHELAEKGCTVSFEDCRHTPFAAIWRVEQAMNREKIAFGTHDVTQSKLDQLKAQAEVKIANQQLAYLKAQGGAKLPSDLDLLEDVCYQVYVKKRALDGNPTEAELKRLVPQGVTYVAYCRWTN